MSLNIENPEAYKRAQELAEATGKSMSQAVIEALREALARARQRGRVLVDQLEAIAEHGASLLVLGDRSPGEILGYGRAP